MGALQTDKAAFKELTPYLMYCIIIMSSGMMIYGLDAASFANFQVLPQFLAVFGQPDGQGGYTLPTQQRAIMTSTQFAGKMAGTVMVSPIVERWGFKVAIYVLCGIQFVGCILEMATGRWEVFTTGRVLQYVTVGILENAGPTYAAELSPAALRAALVTFIMVFQALGGVIMTAVFQGINTSNNPNIWYVPIGLMFVPAIICCIGTPFVVESPRLLVAWGQRDRAMLAIGRLRKKLPDSEMRNQIELESMEAAVEEANRLSSQSGWIDLFRGTNLRRTGIACAIFFFQQWTGMQFVVSFGPLFYTTYGLGSMAFTYNLIARILNLVFSLPVAWLYDKFGRRPLLFIGTFLSMIWLILVGALGGQDNLTDAIVRTVVASVVLLQTCCYLGLSQGCWIVGPEIGSATLRRKTMAAAITVDTLSGFVVSYSTPYMLDAMGNNIGYVFLGFAVAALFWIAFFVPETKGRTLDELDELFERRLWAWQFAKTETVGAASRFAHVNQENFDHKQDVLAMESPTRTQSATDLPDGEQKV